MSDILTEHALSKLQKIGFLAMLPTWSVQIIDNLARIHENVLPWQPAMMGNKAS